MTNLVDGMGFEEVNQEVTLTEIVSGNYIYATTSANTALLNATTVDATTISGTSIRVDSEGLVHSIAAGSPYTYGYKLVTGSNTLSAGSNLWVVFPTAFAGTPKSIVTQDTKTADKALFVVLGSVNTGSFYVEGPTAADTFYWQAVGL